MDGVELGVTFLLVYGAWCELFDIPLASSALYTCKNLNWPSVKSILIRLILMIIASHREDVLVLPGGFR